MARSSKASRSGPIPNQVLDRLYGLPPEEFTAGRNAAAKDLKQAGDAEAARAVQALRRPTAPAAAINRAVRAEPEQARALLDAARDMRRAHEAIMGGKGDRETLRAAVAAERQAVGAVAATAAAESGGEVSADVERRIRDTLEAVALDPQVRERFVAGTLESDARAAGLAADVVAAAPASAKPKRKADQERAERRRLEEAVRKAEAEVNRRRDEVDQAQSLRDRADAALREARKRLRESERELRRLRPR
jgi:hypothetical protein